ncbi:MAG: hypothetical protein H6581_30425 [Bacteroidia bacterium]|nr:hypothetical protein [Bacteroidia bacterium]
MTKNTDELFDLIKSLSVKERIWVRQYSSLRGPETNYIKLFNYLEQVECYDETLLISYFNGEKFLNNLSKAKKYLYDAILESLSLFSFDEEVEAIRFIRRANIAADKRLFHKAFKLVGRGKEKLQSLELFGELLALLEFERNLITWHPSFPTTYKRELLNKNQNEDSVTAERFENYRLNRVLFDKYYYESKIRVLENGSISASFLKEANLELSNPCLDPISVRAKLFNFKLKRWILDLSGDFLGSIKISGQILEIFEKNEFLKRSFGPFYIQEIHHLCLLNIQIENKDQALKLLFFMEKEVSLKSSIMDQILLLELFLVFSIVFSDQIIRSKAISYSTVFQEGLFSSSTFDTFGIHAFLRVYFFLGKIHFESEQFSLAKFWSGKIFNFPSLQIGLNIQGVGRLIYMLSLYKLGDYDGVEICSRQINKFLKKGNRNEVSLCVFDFIIKSLKLDSPDKFPLLLKKVNDRLITLKRLEENKEIYMLFDFQKWVEKEIEIIRPQ